MYDYKKDFPIFEKNQIAYLDNAATTQRPYPVLEALQKFYKEANANPLRGLYELGIRATEQYEDARACVKEFIGASKAKEIIFTRNATESINLVAYSYGLTHLKEEDEILITIEEHHSNLLPWQMVAQQTKAKLVYLECEPDGTFSEEAIKRAVTDRTRIAAVTQVSNVLGRENPIGRLVELVHEKGGVVLVDGAQSVPHQTVDVTGLDIDFLAFSGHKLYGPFGIGVLYGKEELLEEMPPFLRGGEMIDSVHRDSAVFAEVPHKFEAGTVNAAGAVGLAAAIRYIKSIGMHNIERREKELTEVLFQGMQKVPYVKILGSQEAQKHRGIVSFTVEGVHPHDLASIMDESGVAIRAGHHCAQPLLEHLGVSSSARASLAFYNTQEDVEQFLDCLASVRRRMGYGD